MYGKLPFLEQQCYVNFMDYLNDPNVELEEK